MYEYDGVELPRGWAAKIERGEYTYDQLAWMEHERQLWESRPMWEKIAVGAFAVLMPIFGSVVNINF